MVVDVYGAIVGEVDATLMHGCLDGSIYVFSGAEATPDDIDGDLGDPVTETLVKADNSPTGFSYHVDFLVPGDYTVAFVCAGTDDPDQNDELIFTVAPETATVIDDGEEHIDFLLPL